MFRIPLGLLAAVLVAGCGNESSGKTQHPPRPPHLVELQNVEPGRLDYTAIRAGSLRAQREVKIFNEEEGRVTEVTVREGDRVRPGTVLVRYDDRILRAQLDKAAATRKQAESDRERNQQLRAKGFVSEDAVTRSTTVLDIARAEERLLLARVQNMVIAAPFAGVVAHRLVEPGNATPRHTHLLTVIDPSALVTDVTVSELVIPHLKIGDEAKVRIDALGEKQYVGRIVRIHPVIDPATRTGRAEVVLNPVPAGARPGQFCRIVLATGLRDQLIVPLASLQRDAKGEFVFVHREGKVHRTGVESGLRLADRVEILSGLTRGDRIVVKGFLGLKSGQAVKPVTSQGTALDLGEASRGSKGGKSGNSGKPGKGGRVQKGG